MEDEPVFPLRLCTSRREFLGCDLRFLVLLGIAVGSAAVGSSLLAPFESVFFVSSGVVDFDSFEGLPFTRDS